MQINQNSWNIEQQRASFFRPPGIDVDAVALWKSFAGNLPENINQKPSIGVTQVEGNFLNGRLILGVDAHRIDWVLLPLQGANEEPSLILGKYNELHSRFVDAVTLWLPNCPPTLRIAYGCMLVHPVGDRIEGYKWIAQYLPFVQLDAENSSDFNYSINRFRQSKVINGLRINRITKWSVILQMIGSLQVTAGEFIAQSKLTNVPLTEKYSGHLELDINSAADRMNELSPDELNAVFKELVDYADEIATTGDVK